MFQCGGYHITPSTIVFWRCRISLPVKNRLAPGCHLSRHKAQFKEWAQPKFPVAVHHKIKVSKIILYLFFPFPILIFMINCHIIRKKAMPPNMLKTNFFLNQLQLLKIFLLQSQPHPARPNAEINMVVKWNLFVPVELVNPAFLHNSPPFCSL